MFNISISSAAIMAGLSMLRDITFFGCIYGIAIGGLLDITKENHGNPATKISDLTSRIMHWSFVLTFFGLVIINIICALSSIMAAQVVVGFGQVVVIIVTFVMRWKDLCKTYENDPQKEAATTTIRHSALILAIMFLAFHFAIFFISNGAIVINNVKI